MKRAFKMKLKAFFHILEAHSVKQITHFFLENESPTLTNQILSTGEIFVHFSNSNFLFPYKCSL